nr:MAG: ORF1 [TTV-like mini virus]
MPYYNRRYRRRRYYRWPKTWRPRRPFWRKRRRRRWVRTKRKLTKIPIKEWQPEKINKLTIKGFYPLFLCTKDRINNNMVTWLDSVAPHDFPGGGGFAIMQFTIQNLYEEFVKARNWWTKSNCNLPLIRYRGAVFKFYRTEHFDYIVHILRCYPLKANDLLYMSTQPSIMGLTKRSILIPCRQNTTIKKNYKKIRVLPPTQMQTGWHFQKDIANFPLVILTSTVASFDRYYLSSNSMSTTIGFTCLNTKVLQLHDWQGIPTTGYHPADNLYLWGTTSGEQDPKLETLIYLGGTGAENEGTVLKENEERYTNNPGLWGNLFNINYLTQTHYLFKTDQTVSQVVQYYKTHKTEKVSNYTKMSRFTEDLLVPCRYNPFNDKSIGNQVYVVSNLHDHTAWQVPQDKPDVLRKDIPLWLATWGYLDFIRKAQIVSQPDINYMVVLQSPFIQSTPKLTYYVPVDNNFIEDPQTSPYIGTLTASDRLHLYPKITFQIQTMNTIGCSGPGTVKLQTNQSCEAKFEYMFHFKLGGCPAPMDKLCNPSDQAKYPIPNYKQQTTSLQSPSSAIQTYLYNFDERRGILTKKAAERICKDYGTEKTALQITGNLMDVPASPKRPPSEDETTSEEEEEETTFQLLKLRYRQQQLRRRILNLISQNIE